LEKKTEREERRKDPSKAKLKNFLSTRFRSQKNVYSKPNIHQDVFAASKQKRAATQTEIDFQNAKKSKIRIFSFVF
jgi:hypothetical protein